MFSFFYVLPAVPGGVEREKDGFIRVGTAASVARETGWIPATDTVFWPHAQVVGFRQSADRERMLFFARKNQAAAWLKTPNSIAKQAISREPDESVHFGFFPLLDISSVDHEGYPTDIYRVAYVGSSTRPASGTSESRGTPDVTPESSGSSITAEQLSAEFKLQVAFVVDSTASMSQWLDAMKVVVRRVVDKLKDKPQLQGRLEFALVTYRDQLDPAEPQAIEAMEYVTRIDSNFTSDLTAFGHVLTNTSVAKVTSEDFHEDVLAGLVAGIKDLNWARAGYKHIILLGDAPAHNWQPMGTRT